MPDALTNITRAVSLAYTLTASQLMLEQANQVAMELELPCRKPILLEEIRPPFVRHPDLTRSGKLDFGGVITSSNFTFGFYQGQCWKLVRLNLFPNGKPYEYVNPLPYLAELARTPSKVTTNGAYSLATNWLTRFKVRIEDLEAKYGKPLIYQLQCRGENEGGFLDTGIYYVQWGEGSDGAVKVTILGTTKELMELVVDDKELNHQPTLSIKNWQELMATPERTLKKSRPARSESQLD